MSARDDLDRAIASYLARLHPGTLWRLAERDDVRDQVRRPRRGCLRCRVTPEDIEHRAVVVAPSGLAHFGETDGITRCGIDATGDGWWWPL